MEFGLREALIIVGIAAVAVIILNGIMHVRRARMGDLFLPEGRGKLGDSCDPDYFGDELPNGGARVVQRDGGARVDPDIGDGYLGNRVPGERVEPGLGKIGGDVLEPGVTAHVATEDVVPEPEAANSGRTHTPEGVVDQSGQLVDDSGSFSSSGGNDRRVTRGQGRGSADGDKVESEEIIVVYIMAVAGREFQGNELHQALLSCGFRHGEMNIFHRNEQTGGQGQRLFSAANLLEPGTFDLARMADFSTPGICLFLRLPGPKRALYSFDLMIDCSKKIASQFGAEMRDEHHNLMTAQSIEYYRQRVIEFERVPVQ